MEGELPMAHAFAYKKIHEKKMDNYLSNSIVGSRVCLVGNIKSIIYQNSENGFSVYSMTVESELILNQDKIEMSNKEASGEVRLSGYVNLVVGQRFRVEGTVSLYEGLKQLLVDKEEYIEPTTEDSIIDFLSSDLIKGVGDKTAEKMVKGYNTKKGFVEGFGDKTLEVIRENPMALTRISGISASKAMTIHEDYMKNIEYQNVMMFFSKYDISPQKILKIYREFKGASILTARRNPFIFAEKIKGFGFKTCDDIARKLGLDPHDIQRVKHGIIYTLQESTTNGHCFLDEDEIVDVTGENLDIILPLNSGKALLQKQSIENDVEVVLGGLKYQIPYTELKDKIEIAEKSKEYKKRIQIVIDKIPKSVIREAIKELITHDKLRVVSHDGRVCVYLKEVFEIELAVARKIKEINESKVVEVNEVLIEKYISEFESIMRTIVSDFTGLEEKQKLAVKTAFKTNLMCLLGSAGSGKSTSVHCLIFVMKKVFGQNYKIVLTAPTGLASKRLREITGHEAKTIHRLLEYTQEGFVYNETNPLPYNSSIGDEISMLDIFLANDWFSAIDTTTPTKVILIGDPQQLPSIGAGNVLKDLASSPKINTVKLDVIKRQREGSGIIKNANRIINGEMIETDDINKDFFVVEENDTVEVANKILKMIQNLLTKKEYNYTIDDIQVLCPQKGSEIGTEEFNRRIQALVNPPSPSKKEIAKDRSGAMYRVGDRVINTENDKDAIHYTFREGEYIPQKDSKGKEIKGIFNGEIGRMVDVIEKLDEEAEEMRQFMIVKFDDYFIMYDKSTFIKKLDWAYAISIHKSQGSQYKIVLIPIHYRNYIMLTRNLGYTGVTRAKEKVCVVGQLKAMKTMVTTVVVDKRNTRLTSLIA